MKEKIKDKKIEDIIFVIIFLLIIFGGFLIPLVKKKDISYMENREAYQIPKFSINSFLDGSFQDTYEKALADQLPLAGTMKLAQKSIATLTKIAYYKMTNSLYKDLGGIFLIENNLLYAPMSLDSLKNNIDNKVENYNNVVNKIDNVEWYLYYIEKDTDINFEDNSKTGVYEYFIKNLTPKIKTQKFAIDNFDEFKKYFYRTDHHWNYKGSYKGYSEIIQMISNDEPINWKEEKDFGITLSGSKANAIGGKLLFKEPFKAYIFDLPDYDLYINNNKAEQYGNKTAYLNNQVLEASYGDYYGNDIALLEFDFHRPEKENLLIVGESYDNAINDLLASHFNKTYNVDLRAYALDYKEEFNIEEFIKQNDIDKVLLIGNIDYIDSATFMLKGD